MKLSEIQKPRLKLSQVLGSNPVEKSKSNSQFGSKDDIADKLGMTPEQLDIQVRENRASLLPMIGQVVGSPLGGVGATGGAMVGQVANQLIKAVPGQQFLPESRPSLGAVGREGLTTGLIEGLTRGTGGLIFRRQIASNQLKELGRKLGSMKQELSSNPELKVSSDQIYFPLKQAMEDIAVPHGPQATVINKWLGFMEKNPSMSAKHLIEMEKDLGEVSRYGEFEKGAFIQPTIRKPALNQAAKSSRNQVSNIIDKISEGSGQKGFKKISLQISKLLSNPDKTDVTKSSGNFISRILAGAAAGGLTQDPGIGIGTYLGLQGLQSPETRNVAFRALNSKTGNLLSRTSKIYLSDLARKSANQ